MVGPPGHNGAMTEQEELERATRAILVHGLGALAGGVAAVLAIHIAAPAQIWPKLLGSGEVDRAEYLIPAFTLLGVFAAVVVVGWSRTRAATRHAPAKARPALLAWRSYLMWTALPVGISVLVAAEGIASRFPGEGQLWTLAVVGAGVLAGIGFYLTRASQLEVRLAARYKNQPVTTAPTAAFSTPSGAPGSARGSSQVLVPPSRWLMFGTTILIAVGGSAMATLQDNPMGFVYLLIGVVGAITLIANGGLRWTILVTEGGVQVSRWPGRRQYSISAGQIARAELAWVGPGAPDEVPGPALDPRGLSLFHPTGAGGLLIALGAGPALRVVRSSGVDLIVSTRDAPALVAAVNEIAAGR